jgi:hypothetical protein
VTERGAPRRARDVGILGGVGASHELWRAALLLGYGGIGSIRRTCLQQSGSVVPVPRESPRAAEI